jgi:hypothetical protein
VKPNLVILAFIADDLSRDRFWRTNVSLDGSDRLFVTTENSSRPDLQSVQDYMIIEPRVNDLGCGNLLGTSASDGLIDELHHRFWTLQDEGLKSGVARYTTSMLYDRLRYDDPYFTLRKVPRMPRVSFSDFRENTEFVSDVQSLISQPVPVLFVMLPVYQDFVSGKIRITEQHENLLASFASLVPTGIVDLYDVSERPEKPLEKYFLLPHDPHPSEYGAQWYAKQIVEVITKRKLLDSSRELLQQK